MGEKIKLLPIPDSARDMLFRSYVDYCERIERLARKVFLDTADGREAAEKLVSAIDCVEGK